MADFCVKIAGHTARITGEFDSTPHYFRDFLTEDAPEIHLTVTEADRQAEQAALREEALAEGLRPRTFAEPFLERSALQKQMADFLFDREILLLHGSTVAVDGIAYLFTAPCGTGKSTHTRLWCQAFGSRAQMVNDDKPFLTLTDSGVWASGSPWTGKHGIGNPITVPLGGICLLERGGENRIRRAQRQTLLPILLHQTHCPSGKEVPFRALVEALADRVPLWHMTCTKDMEAAHVAYAAMTEQ